MCFHERKFLKMEQTKRNPQTIPTWKLSSSQLVTKQAVYSRACWNWRKEHTWFFLVYQVNQVPLTGLDTVCAPYLLGRRSECTCCQCCILKTIGFLPLRLSLLLFCSYFRAETFLSVYSLTPEAYGFYSLASFHLYPGHLWYVT